MDYLRFHSLLLSSPIIISTSLEPYQHPQVSHHHTRCVPPFTLVLFKYISVCLFVSLRGCVCVFLHIANNTESELLASVSPSFLPKIITIVYYYFGQESVLVSYHRLLLLFCFCYQNHLLRHFFSRNTGHADLDHQLCIVYQLHHHHHQFNGMALSSSIVHYIVYILITPPLPLNSLSL